MIRIKILTLSFFWAVFCVTLICAQDLSNYRDFQLGMNLTKVAEQAGMEAAQAKLIHERPAVIQEFEWRPGISANFASTPDPFEEILFGFYNNQIAHPARAADSNS